MHTQLLRETNLVCMLYCDHRRAGGLGLAPPPFIFAFLTLLLLLLLARVGRRETTTCGSPNHPGTTFGRQPSCAARIKCMNCIP